MPETYVSIGRVKRDISDLVNRVAYSGERIVLTSRGKPKAALVSIRDYERLEEERAHRELASWQAWEQECRRLAADILTRRGGATLDVEALWQQARMEAEEHNGRVRGD